MVKVINIIPVFLLLTGFLEEAKILNVQKVINTNGYYYGTYEQEMFNNTFFERTGVCLVKFDSDGFCNVFSLQVLKGETIEQTIASIISRSQISRKGRGRKENSGKYSVKDTNHIDIAYLILNNPDHLFGKYIYKRYEGIVVSDTEIQLYTGKGKINLKLVIDTVVFKNYLRK